MKRLVLVVAVSAIACIAVFAALVQAKPKAYPTTTTLEVKKTTLAGKISSPKAACLKGRRVHGFFRGPGAQLETEFVTTDSSGKWTIDFEVAPGTKGELTISVSPKKAGGISCKGGATSEIVAVR